MTYNRDNIVGVEFTVKGGFGVEYAIKSVNEIGTPVIEYHSKFAVKRNSTAYPMWTVLNYLNSGTWIVKPKQ